MNLRKIVAVATIALDGKKGNSRPSNPQKINVDQEIRDLSKDWLKNQYPEKGYRRVVHRAAVAVSLGVLISRIRDKYSIDTPVQALTTAYLILGGLPAMAKVLNYSEEGVPNHIVRTLDKIKLCDDKAKKNDSDIKASEEFKWIIKRLAQLNTIDPGQNLITKTHYGINTYKFLDQTKSMARSFFIQFVIVKGMQILYLLGSLFSENKESQPSLESSSSNILMNTLSVFLFGLPNIFMQSILYGLPKLVTVSCDILTKTKEQTKRDLLNERRLINKILITNKKGVNSCQ